MNLLTDNGIKTVPEKQLIKSLFCKHKNVISGESCSKNGLVRISGSDIYTVCQDCGKILNESHYDY